jgi:hypothetical protein
MQTLESLVSALVESLRKSGLSIVEGMTGEYWITDTNKILDASPAKHSDLAMRVLAPMGSKLRDFLKQFHGKETDIDFSSLPADELEKHKDFIE